MQILNKQPAAACACNKEMNTICAACAVADLAVWQAGYDARQSPDLRKHENPYCSFNQIPQWRSWLSGFMSADLTLRELG
jgi:hypothetical protein